MHVKINKEQLKLSFVYVSVHSANKGDSDESQALWPKSHDL